MRRTWRDLEKDHDELVAQHGELVIKHETHVVESTFNSTELGKKLDKLTDAVQPISEFFKSTKLINLVFKWILGVLVSFIAIGAGIKQIFR